MKISIITATYNRKKAVERCVRSVLAQTHADVEHIVVDDGSTDGTAELFEEGGSLNDPRVRFEKLKHNHGCATPARNRGLEIMTGDAFIIWDSDDELLPEAVATLVAVLNTRPDIDIASAPAYFLRAGVEIEVAPVPDRNVSFADKLAGVLPANEAVILIRTSCLGNIRYQSRNLDFIFMTRLAKNCSWFHVQQKLATVHLTSDKLSLTTQRKRKSATISIERARVLGPFVRQFRDDYVRHAPATYGELAYGATLGYVLASQKADARYFGVETYKYNRHLKRRIVVFLAWMPCAAWFLKQFIYRS